jgi:predicted nucleic acid-binding protein
MSIDFLDSNVLAYQFDENAPRKRTLAANIVSEAVATGSAVISYQVVQETLSLLTGKFSTVATPGDAMRFFDTVLAPLWTVMPSARLYGHAVTLQSRYGFRFYDSLIVAAALEAGCDRLLSEDFQDGQRIEGLTVVNPFRDVS